MAGLGGLNFNPSKLNKATAADYSSSDSDADDNDDFQVPSCNPHDDEFGDFNPRKRRRTGRDAKEDAALGIFGSESEDEGPRWKRKNLRTKGVSFVSSANNKPANSDDEDEIDDEEDEEDEYDARPSMKAVHAEDDEENEEEEEESRGVGLGFKGAAAAAATGGQGLGWVPPTQQQKEKSPPRRQSFVKSTINMSNPLGPGFTPSSAKAPTLLANDDNEPPTRRVALPSAFAQAKGGKTKTNKMSFAARMMAKMGYEEGKGLGAEGQGRNVIIEANLRPQGAGLGAVREKTQQEREEEKRQARLRGEELVDSEEEEKKKKAARRKNKSLGGGLGSGTASAGSTPRPKKPKYMTLDEVKKVAPGLNIPDAFTPILDMTGPGKKMLTTSSGLMTPTGTTTPAESTEAAESRKLVRRAQNDFMAILEEWQSLQERKAYAELQLKQEQQELDELTASLQANRAITGLCEVLSTPVESGEFDKKDDLDYKLRRTIQGLEHASSAFSDAMLPQIKDEVALLAVAAIYPALREYLQIWKPLEDPKPKFVDGLVSIKKLLGLDQKTKPTHRRATATPYETMMYQLWLPAVASAVRIWDVREPDQLIAVFEAWDGLIPTFIRSQLLQDIVRKLEEAVQKWHPKKKSSTSNLPHGWIFPWLPYLPATHLDPKSSTGLVADVKRKFRQLVDVWEFNRGVIPGLKQWKEVLRPHRGSDQWGPLVMNHVLPNMARYMRKNFRVDPRDQEPYMDMLDGLFKWLDVIRPSMVGEVIVAEVFPMWHDALYQWLLLDTANYEQIGQWFEWWQDSVFPEEIKSLPSITAEFEKGMKMIERALDLGDRAKTDLKAPERGPALPSFKSSSSSRHDREHRHHVKHREREAQAQAAAAEAEKNKQPEEITFRHALEDWCQENDMQFIPERKKMHADGPYYRITARGDGKGGVLVRFKGDVLFVEVKGQDALKIHREPQSGWEALLELVL
ncbi:hypothetical protein SMAC4_07480 [Sordaria macrospora]|uniref:uncharacterized protein n=1 Tax=Sordaria macrospora TaxID=5147 RepID=UPI002B2AC828|nr:hypothetical protein SMAC4_07480 [Sordaria macrospora]